MDENENKIKVDEITSKNLNSQENSYDLKENNNELNEEEEKNIKEPTVLTEQIPYEIPIEKYLLEINENGLPFQQDPNKIFSINVNSEITFKMFNGISISNDVILISNYLNDFPNNFNFIFNNEKFKNNNFIFSNELIENFNNFKTSPTSINTEINFKILFERPGNFLFFFIYKAKIINNNNKNENNDSNTVFKHTKPFTILVNPYLEINQFKKIPINKITMQSVLSKNIGYLDNFIDYFTEASLLKYNMIHFTTFQTLSESNNIYCIKDQTEIDDIFFQDEIITKREKFYKLKECIDSLKENYEIGSCVDIILNQTSIESHWIQNNRECLYNLENCPWLNVAYQLDKILNNYSILFGEKKVNCKSAPYIDNEKDLEECIDEIKKEIYKNNLYEYFLINIETVYDEFKDCYKNLILDPNYNLKRNFLLQGLYTKYKIKATNDNKLILNENTLYDLIIQSCSNYGYERYGVQMEIQFITLLLLEATRDIQTGNILHEFYFLCQVKKYINKINEEWTKKANDMLGIAILNIKEFIRYEFLTLGRPGTNRKLIDNYFYVLDENDKSKIFLCNGYIMQSEEEGNMYPDITKYGKYYHLKRKVIISNDSLKINFGNSIETCPNFILENFGEYIKLMSSIFDGLFIDNIIYIPDFILKFLINEARKINPNIILIANIPEDDNKQLLSKYSNDFGINLFTKEMIWCSDINEISNTIESFGKKVTNTENIFTDINKNLYLINKSPKDNNLYIDSYKYLSQSFPNTILFDLSIDNESYYQRYQNISLNLSMMACSSLLNCSTGSVRGFDQLFPFQPSVVQENRMYIYDERFEHVLNELNKKEKNIDKINEIFFEFHPANSVNPNTNTVKLALSSHGWKPDIELTKINSNLFIARVLLPKGKYKYKYVLDNNIWTYDPSQPMEYDENRHVNNVLDLIDDTKILSNDIKLLRRDINNIRDELKNVKTESFIQRDKDVICIMKIIQDDKNLIENNEINQNDNIEYFKKKFNVNNNKNYDNIYDFYTPDENKNNNNTENKNKNVIEKNPPFDGYAIICRPGFDVKDNPINSKIIIPYEITDFICGCYMNLSNIEANIITSETHLRGINGDIYYTKDLNFLNSIAKVSIEKGNTIIEFHSILPNTVIILKLNMSPDIRNSVTNLNKNINFIFNQGYQYIDYYDINDINAVLFKTENEEKDNNFNKYGTFGIDLNDIYKEYFGNNVDNNDNNNNENNKFVYAGINQLIEILKHFKKYLSINSNININNFKNNNIFKNIISGDYLMDYIITRISQIKSFNFIYNFIQDNLINFYKILPSNLKPLFFDKFLFSIYYTTMKLIFSKLPSYLVNFGNFAEKLSIARHEFIGHIIGSTYEYDLGKKNLSIKSNLLKISISAGLPNYDVSSYRMFVRDTLISFKSLFLIPNLFDEAKTLLKIIASTLRHGLIPNLFDKGVKPRFNARDCPWLFIKSVKDYMEYSNDNNFLQEEIDLVFVTEKSYHENLRKRAKGQTLSSSIENIIQTIFEAHGVGINFKEWFAGHDLEQYLRHMGFEIKININNINGFIFGGNSANNGTWMDRLNKDHNNKGPFTPRDGADIEIISLLYTCLNFVIEMNEKNLYSKKGVVLNNGINLDFIKWRDLIKENFEKEFFVTNSYNNFSTTTNRNNFYKDYISNLETENRKKKDNQLRPNALIAIISSPELFTNLDNINKYLENVENYLLDGNKKTLGLKTLDKYDQNYKGVYNNDDNIHNGLEFIWLYGYYLLVKIKYTKWNNDSECLSYISEKLIPLMKYIEESKWMGLPEFTDQFGNVVKGVSCETNCKSVCMMFEVINELALKFVKNNNKNIINENDNKEESNNIDGVNE